MNTAERASLTGMVIAFLIVVFGAVIQSQTTCTQYVFGTCVSQTNGSAGGAALVIFGIVLLLVSAFFLAYERMWRPRTPSANATAPPGTRSIANLFCRSCGAQIPPDSGFCPKCGKAVA
jgi:ribosomal protein L40E